MFLWKCVLLIGISTKAHNTSAHEHYCSERQSVEDFKADPRQKEIIVTHNFISDHLLARSKLEQVHKKPGRSLAVK